MHAIINILFDCKLRNIYGLKWTTTSKRSLPPRGREWKICLNMKVVKWVAAHTGMFIKRSVKTGKTLAIDRFTHSTRFYCQCVCAGCSYVSGELSCVIVFVFMGALQTVHPQTNQRDMFHCYVQVFTCLPVHMGRSLYAWMFRNALVQDAMFTCVQCLQEFTC